MTDKKVFSGGGLAARRSLALPMASSQKILLVGRRSAEPQASKLRSLQLPAEFGHWGLGFVWNLRIGIYLRAIIPCQKTRLVATATSSVCSRGKRAACLKEMDFRGYFALRLPRGVTVAPEILDLFV
jgi:hypothetical protein